MKSYTVCDHALGLANGPAKQGETVTAEQIGEENIPRLLMLGSIVELGTAPPVMDTPKTPSAPQVSDSDPEPPHPDALQARLAVGVPPAEDYELTDEDKVWITEIKEGVIPAPFNAAEVDKLTIKNIGERVKILSGQELAKSANKTQAAAALETAISDYFADWELPE